MTDAQKVARLRMAIDALRNAGALVQEVLGDTDVGCETNDRIQEIIDDLICDVTELSS